MCPSGGNSGTTCSFTAKAKNFDFLLPETGEWIDNIVRANATNDVFAQGDSGGPVLTLGSSGSIRIAGIIVAGAPTSPGG